MVLVLLLALAAAAGFGTSSVLEQRAASAVPADHALRLGLIARLLRRPLWLAGVATEWVADAFQATALAFGSLVVVQPVLVSGLLFALPLSARWNRQRLGPREWLGALAVVSGLALFLGVGQPGGEDLDASSLRWLLCGLPVVAFAFVAVIGGRRLRGLPRPVLLAAAAGTVSGLADACTKATVDNLHNGIFATLLTWRPYAMVGVGLLVTLLAQSAFQAGPLAASLPALTASEPIAASLLGLVLFGDHLASSPWELALEAVAAVVMTVGVVALATSPLVCAVLRPGHGADGAEPEWVCDPDEVPAPTVDPDPPAIATT